MTLNDSKEHAMYAYVGCRTTEKRKARGKGIQVYRVDPLTYEWTHVQLLPHAANPAFLAFGRNEDFLYVVHGDFSEVSSYKVDKTSGELTFVNQQHTQGTNLVHLALSPDFDFVVVSNHITGSLASLPVEADGSLGPLRHLLKIEGKAGPDRHHQTGPRPHHNPYDPRGRHLVVPDKGIDEIYTVKLNPQTGELSIANRIRTRERSGPRHVDFHPRKPWAYVVNELDFTIGAYRYDAEAGALEPFQMIPTVPDSYTGDNSGAEIAVSPDGRFVFVSNRGHESIGTFEVDQQSGRLSARSWEPTQGLTPRYFTLTPDGKRLFVGNEDSDNIVEFAVDPDGGKLTPTGQVIQTGSPVCVIFSRF
jgi:6-phosphogluconolactonase